jgi:hypothetical protein
MANRRTAFIANPTIYVTWAVIVVAALVLTYFSDPYIFAFTAIGLAWLTAVITLVGLSAVLRVKRAHASTRMRIVVAIVVAVAAIVVAFSVLRTFKWA